MLQAGCVCDIDLLKCQVGNLSEEQKRKVLSMSQRDIEIKERRALYNQLGRRMENPVGLKPGSLA